MNLRALPKLDARLYDDSPLSHLLHARQAGQESARVRAGVSSLFDQFHLKFSVATELEGRRAKVNGKSIVHLGMPQFLGLEQHPEVRYAAKRAIDEIGTQAGCTRFFASHQNVLDLEANLSYLLGAEATLIGQSVFQIHAGVLPALFGDEDSVLFVDKLAHPSLVQGAMLAKAYGARVVRVDVHEPAVLAKILQKEKPSRGAILLDGISACRGQVPELKALNELCDKFGLILYVDDSSGIGVLGAHGGGVAEACGLSFANLLVAGSLENAFGSAGGFLSGKAACIDFLRVASKAQLLLGAPSPAAVEGALASVRIARSNEGRKLRLRLADIAQDMRLKLQELGFNVAPGVSPILSVQIGRDIKTLLAGRKLFDMGVYVPSLTYPFAARGRGVLRVSLSALHTREDLNRLTFAFRELREYLVQHENPLKQAAYFVFEVGKSKCQGKRYAGL